VQEHLIELSIGETLQVSQYKVTLLEINGDELCLQVVSDDDHDDHFIGSPEDLLTSLAGME
jgi:hypothetical protein